MAARRKPTAKCIVCGKMVKSWQVLKTHYRVSVKCGQELARRRQEGVRLHRTSEMPLEEIARKLGLHASMLRREIRAGGFQRRAQGPDEGGDHKVRGLPTMPEPPKRKYVRRNGRGLNFCPNCGQDLTGWR